MSSRTAVGPVRRRPVSALPSLVSCAGRIPARLLRPKRRASAPAVMDPAASLDGQLAVDASVTTAAALDCCLLSRCLWCREAVGWLCHARVWIHLRSCRLPCVGIAGGWAAANPDLTIPAPHTGQLNPATSKPHGSGPSRAGGKPRWSSPTS
jgi:hypothetical protein